MIYILNLASNWGKPELILSGKAMEIFANSGLPCISSFLSRILRLVIS